jgi:hypothetical protein
VRERTPTSPPGDDGDEMTTAADDAAVEDAFEAHLAGRPVSDVAADAFPGLAAFSEAVRATATQPGRPSAALAELLVTGLLTDQSSPSTATARSAGSPPARRPARVRIRRRTAMFIPALLAKLLSAGAVAQAATGAGVAVVLVTGAGAVGALPDPVQNTVSSVVGAVTPFDLPSGDETAGDEPATDEPVVEEPTAEQPAVEDPAVEDPEAEQPVVEDPAAFDPEAWAVDGPQDGQTFGQWVSLGAHNKASLGEDVRFGQIVSAWAHKKHLDAADLENEGVDLDELTDTPDEPATEVEPETGDAQQQATTQSGSHGKGGSKGNGSGKGDATSTGNGKSGEHGNGHKGGNGKN